MSQEDGGGSCAVADQNFHMMTHLAQYGVLGFILTLGLGLGLRLGLGLIAVWLIVYRKLLGVASAAGAGEGRSSSINDGSPSSHDQSPPEGTTLCNDIGTSISLLPLVHMSL